MLIWKDPNTRKRYKVGELEASDQKYIFKYVDPDLSEAIGKGFKNYPTFPDLKKTYTSVDMFTTILERLPRKKRPDYKEILSRYNLEESSSDIEILTATRGRTPTDPFEFIQVLQNSPELPFEVKFEIAGIRHYDSPQLREEIGIGSALKLNQEPENKWDPYAVLVMTNSELTVGYVPKYYSKTITDMLVSNQGYHAEITRVDFSNETPDEWVQVSVRVVI
jgi:hypothetical protein